MTMVMQEEEEKLSKLGRKNKTRAMWEERQGGDDMCVSKTERGRES